MPPMATTEPRGGFQQRPRRAAEPDLGEEFQRKPRLPVGIGLLEEIAAPRGAGIVDQNVEAAETLLCKVDKPLRLGLALQIGGMDLGAAAGGPNLGGNLIERSLIARGEQQVAAQRRKLQRDGAADAAARAGDERHFSLKLEMHCERLRPRETPRQEP